jgi:hypothetical protein
MIFSDMNKTSLEQRIAAIEQRNAVKEADKAWETSVTRRASITLLTYCCMVAMFSILKNSNPWSNALVPTLGFILSTVALNSLKRFWTRVSTSNK